MIVDADELRRSAAGGGGPVAAAGAEDEPSEPGQQLLAFATTAEFYKQSRSALGGGLLSSRFQHSC